LTARTIRKFRIGPSIRIESRIGHTIRNRIESRSFAGPYLLRQSNNILQLDNNFTSHHVAPLCRPPPGGERVIYAVHRPSVRFVPCLGFSQNRKSTETSNLVEIYVVLGKSRPIAVLSKFEVQRSKSMSQEP